MSISIVEVLVSKLVRGSKKAEFKTQAERVYSLQFSVNSFGEEEPKTQVPKPNLGHPPCLSGSMEFV
jgi:hypothetical protein